MSRTFISREGLVVAIATLLILTFTPGLALADAGRSDRNSTVARTEHAERPADVYTYKVPKTTIRKAKRFCHKNYGTLAVAYSNCTKVQDKRKTQTQVIKTRTYWMARKSSIDDGWWYFYVRPILKNDRKQLTSTNTDILALIAELCKVKKCGGSPSTSHPVKGWDWVGGTYVGVLLSRHLTVRWSRELSAIDGAAAGAAYLCGKIPKIGVPGVVATGLCVAIVAFKYGGIKSDFQIAKNGSSTKCVELRFHTLYAIGLADASKVVHCQ